MFKSYSRAKARLLALSVMIGAFMVTSMAVAFATPPDPSTVLGTAADSLVDELLDTAVAVLPYAATLAALYIGWRMVKRFVR